MSINLWHVAFHSLWILGASVILAAFSHSYWQAQQQGKSLVKILNAVSIQQVLSVGFMLISLSLSLLAQVWWERGLWLVFVLTFAWQFWQMGQNNAQ